jgi:hypothetical protein
MEITENLIDQSSSMHALSLLSMRPVVSSHEREHGRVKVENDQELSGTYAKPC